MHIHACVHACMRACMHASVCFVCFFNTVLMCSTDCAGCGAYLFFDLSLLEPAIWIYLYWNLFIGLLCISCYNLVLKWKKWCFLCADLKDFFGFRDPSHGWTLWSFWYYVQRSAYWLQHDEVSNSVRVEFWLIWSKSEAARGLKWITRIIIYFQDEMDYRICLLRRVLVLKRHCVDWKNYSELVFFFCFFLTWCSFLLFCCSFLGFLYYCFP